MLLDFLVPSIVGYEKVEHSFAIEENFRSGLLFKIKASLSHVEKTNKC